MTTWRLTRSQHAFNNTSHRIYFFHHRLCHACRRRITVTQYSKVCSTTLPSSPCCPTIPHEKARGNLPIKIADSDAPRRRNHKEQVQCSSNSCKRQSDSDGDGGDLEGELLELVDIVLEITEEALGANYSGSGSGTFVGGNFLSPTIVIDPNYQNGH